MDDPDGMLPDARLIPRAYSATATLVVGHDPPRAVRVRRLEAATEELARREREGTVTRCPYGLPARYCAGRHDPTHTCYSLAAWDAATRRGTAVRLGIHAEARRELCSAHAAGGPWGTGPGPEDARERSHG